MVQVPVQVLLDGEPVRGLEAADFELREDGARRVVSGFEVVELGPSAPAVHAAFPAARSAQPPAPQAAQPPAPQAAQPPAGRS
ncbi:MAG TPA: hypothetical protein VE075_12665 [Thermoanaerobaculia bacterium]|nr:hypothetical protein [Thermoanaerobaculia bacterium]